MRRLIAALVVTLLAIALVALAAQAGASAPLAGESETSGSWWQKLLDTVWSALAGADATAPDGAAAAETPSGPDQGPTMDPNG